MKPFQVWLNEKKKESLPGIAGPSHSWQGAIRGSAAGAFIGGLGGAIAAGPVGASVGAALGAAAGSRLGGYRSGKPVGGRTAATTAGTVAGGIIGSTILPGVGTAAGAAVGGAVGYGAGKVIDNVRHSLATRSARSKYIKASVDAANKRAETNLSKKLVKAGLSNDSIDAKKQVRKELKRLGHKSYSPVDSI